MIQNRYTWVWVAAAFVLGFGGVLGPAHGAERIVNF
jgi:hypothetical protein